MEEIDFNTTKVQVKVEPVEPDEVTSTKKWWEPNAKRAKKTWGPKEPTEEEKYFKTRTWGEPKTEFQKKSEELKEAFDRDRIVIENGCTWYRTDLKTFHLFRKSFFDSRWFRTVYWDKRTEQYESRAPYPKGSAPKPVVREATEDWKEETFEEFNERRKSWKPDRIRLEHKDVVLGAKHQLFEHPDHPLVRIIAVNCEPLPPKVLVKDDRTNKAWSIFTDELDKQVFNTKRNIKNWQKRRRTAWKTSGTSIWDTVILEEDPENEGKTPSYPNYRLSFSA